MAKRKVTAEDIEKNPSLVDRGYNVGDDYEFPEDEVTSKETKKDAETNEGGEEGEEGDGNGGNHPPGKGGN